MVAAARTGTSRTGEVMALLFYGLFLHMLKPVDINLSIKLDNNLHVYHYNHGYFYTDNANLDYQTIQAAANFKHGKYTLATIFIYPQLYYWVIKCKSVTKVQQSDMLIIALNLFATFWRHPPLSWSTLY